MHIRNYSWGSVLPTRLKTSGLDALHQSVACMYHTTLAWTLLTILPDPALNVS